MTLEQKAEALAFLGVSRLAVLPFDARVAATSAEDFARAVLKDALGAVRVVVGEGFRFGRGRSGDVGALRSFGAALGFEVKTVAPVFDDGAPISSSRIRDLLASGEVEKAAALLGRPYFVDGTVVRGDGRGRGLGIPTANVAPRNETLPADGVYACRVRPGAGAPFQAAVANLGRRPTFGPGASTLEAHLLDFDGDLYGREMRLEFRARLRGEKAFPGIGELLDQVRKDIEAARAFLEKPR
jgi:riboflavin kinase/FMN adenylyltransferase